MRAQNFGGDEKPSVVTDPNSGTSTTTDWGILAELVAQMGRVDDSYLHGLMYVLQAGYGLPISYRFQMRLTGPYSDELLEDLQRLEGYGVLKARQGGYLIDSGPDARTILDQLEEDHREVILLLVKELRNLSPVRAEVIPTVLLAMRETTPSNNQSAEESIIGFTSSLKPSVPRDDVVEALREMRALLPSR
jgi:hypothetical protein